MTRKCSSPTPSKSTSDSDLPQALGWVLFGLAVTALAYGLLFQRYRVEDLDDAWSLSYIHQYARFGIESDPIFGGPSRMLHFGKVQALATWPLLDLFGWTRGVAHSLSTLWMVLAAFFWSLTLFRLGSTKVFALGFGMLALLMEPFLASAYSARPEAFVFFLCSLSLWAWVEGWGFPAALAAGLAIETHPMGVMAFVYNAAACFHPFVRTKLRTWRRASWLFFGFGFALSAGLYLALHPQAFTTLGKELGEGNTQSGRSINNYLFDYFFKTKHLRHLPELLLFAGATLIFTMRRSWKSAPFPAALFCLTLLSTLILSRPNYHYALYAYPSFLLLFLTTASSTRHLRFAIAALCLLVAPQYLYLYHKNRSFDGEGHLRVLRAHVPDDGLPVLGSAKEWFAFKDRTFRWSQYVGDRAKLDFEEAHLVEEDDYRASPGSLKPWVEERFHAEETSAVTLSGEVYRFLDLRRVDPEGSKPRP